MKILVVDDEPLIGQYIVQCVRNADPLAEVVGVTSGAKALRRLDEELFDILFADITMPKMDGLELLQRVREGYPSVNVIMLTCHEDFEYVRAAMQHQAADYLLKNEISEERLRGLLERLQTSRKEKLAQAEQRHISRGGYLRRVLDNDPAVMPIRAGSLRANHIYLEDRAFAALFFSSGEENMRVVQEYLAESFENPLFYAYNDKEMLLLMNLRRDSPDSAVVMECFAQYAARMTGAAGHSRVYQYLEHLQTAMLEAVANREYRFYGAPPEGAEPQAGAVQAKQRAMRAVTLLADGRVNEACAEIGRLAEDAERQQPPATQLMETAAQLLANIGGKAGEAGQHAEQCASFAELRQMLGQCAAQLQSQGKLYSAPIRKALDYIALHFSEELSLNTVADFVYLNRDHLSRQFKKEVGVNFSEYLMDLRLKEAKKLLETTNLRISDVALRVGITNLSYFSTVFHKAFGSTPNEFRKRSQGRA